MHCRIARLEVDDDRVAAFDNVEFFNGEFTHCVESLT